MNITKQVDDNRGMGKRLKLIFSAVLTILMFLAPDAKAQNPLTIGGNITMNITTGAAGGQPVPVSTPTTTLKYWRQASAVAKITVQTSCPTQAFSLAVIATGVSKGTAQGPINLISGAAAQDFITNISNLPGWASTTVTLQYTASATFAQGNSAEMGNDVHTVTYTLMVQ